ncbi:hypothetical protein QR680_006268 [Steinernema hermaphroditum]|uniref:Cation-transporting P-type ATPase N-terminal domain-containing protein n=1 Tax=Steinernema hermaphroditum TaxID=289476 RepID=A0AA39LWU8_9BILA|nr:hypothetical protein QR680_006268 [Steinernema hermaphroditum]
MGESGSAFKWIKRKLRGGSEDDAEKENESMASARNLGGSFTEHAMDLSQLSKAFPATNVNSNQPEKSVGLSQRDAQTRFELDGPNILAPPKEISDLKLLLKQFLNVFWLLQIVAGVLSLITYIVNPAIQYNLWIAILLFGIVIIMCIVQYIEEKKALAVIQAFSQLVPVKCTIIRGGQSMTVEADQIVVGDIVCIKTGGRVPADLRLIHTVDLKLETSSITGESEPIEFTSEKAGEGVTVFDSCNVAFNGSYCVEGEGYGIAIRTAERTIIGQIASLTTDQSKSMSTLDIEVHRFVKIVTVAAIVVGTTVFLIGGFIQKWSNVSQLFMNGFLVAIISTVPQGLPTTVSSELTIIAHRMAKKNVYMKKLDVVDAFGATTVVASDKTGTLTQNNMKVTDLWYGFKYLNGLPEVSHKVMKSLGKNSEVTLDALDHPLPDLMELMVMCNKATVECDEEEGLPNRGHAVMLSIRSNKKTPVKLWKPSKKNKVAPVSAEAETSPAAPHEKKYSGSPTEVAVLKYVDEICDADLIREKYEVVFEVPFHSKRKFHIMIVKKANQEADKDGMMEFTVMMKGAPEVVIQKCSTIATADGEVALDEDATMSFQDAYDHFGNNGRRVIGFAKTKFTTFENTKFAFDELNFPLEELQFVGISAIMDPPRPDTAEAIRQCKEAGIKVFMVTGDHPSTATAIAREIGLIGEPETVIHHGHKVDVSKALESGFDQEQNWATVHGKDLPGMSDSDWDQLLKKKYIVFARTTPEHKLMIVENCQKRGEIVTVTGDGVNDAPALKRANIGVAMGLTGSDVAKQAADVVLMDDKFASIIHGIEEGRLLFDNLRKSIGYTLSHCFSCIVPMLLNFIGGTPQVMSALQMLSIDLATDLPPAISLAYENAERNIMKCRPRKRTSRLVSMAMLAYSYQIAAYFILLGSISAYFYTYWRNGIAPKDLFYTNTDFFDITTTKNFTSNGKTFSPEEQLDISWQACAACYIATVTGQAWHIWMCRTRRMSIFTHGFRNIATFIAVAAELAILAFLVYVPKVNYVMNASSPPFEVWFFSAGSCALLLVYNEVRKFFIRRSPYNKFVRLVKW